MKNSIFILLVIIVISLISCDTLTKYTVRVSVDKHPTLTIVNQTGYPVVVTAPLSINLNNETRIQYHLPDTIQNIDVAYMINQFPFAEQVTMNDADATITLTKRPPTLVVLNQTGYSVTVISPVYSTIADGTSSQFLIAETNQSVNVTYRIGQIDFSEQVIMNNTDAAVTLTKRPPTVTVINQTGRTVSLTNPQHSSLNNGERINFLPPVLTGYFDVTYSSGLMHLTEQVTMNNQDVTVNLTVGAPTLTIVNNTGTGNNINIIQFRTPGSNAWTGGNIIIINNELRISEGAAQTGITTQVLTNGERLSFWLGNNNLSGNAFDIRLQTPSDVIFQKDNVRITSDMTLTFTQSDRR